MARTPEGTVKVGVKKVLEEFGAWYYMPVQNGMGVSGIPDFIACVDGKFIAIETKAPGRENAVTAQQRKQLDGILTHGGLALVITNPDALRTALKIYLGDGNG